MATPQLRKLLLIFPFPQQSIRYGSFILSVLVAITSSAQASMTCMRIEQFPAVSDPLIQEQIQTYLKKFPRFQKNQTRQINSRFFVAISDDGECDKAARCYHQLLDIKNGAIKDVFAFRSTGMVWILVSPVAAWSEFFQDDYSAMAFETPDTAYLQVLLPRLSDTVLVNSMSPEETRMLQRLCANFK
jgi:hypothetical protein